MMMVVLDLAHFRARRFVYGWNTSSHLAWQNYTLLLDLHDLRLILEIPNCA